MAATQGAAESGTGGGVTLVAVVPTVAAEHDEADDGGGKGAGRQTTLKSAGKAFAELSR